MCRLEVSKLICNYFFISKVHIKLISEVDFKLIYQKRNFPKTGTYNIHKTELQLLMKRDKKSK